MIGLDTNVIVRYLAQDDPKQSSAATRLFESTLSADNPGHVATISLAEVAWVLRSGYGASREEIATAIEGLLTSNALSFEHKPLVWRALRQYLGTTADFADCLTGQINAAAGCDATLTFDRTAAALPEFRPLSS
jgi:predicted nucleic-acid-binding protein